MIIVQDNWQNHCTLHCTHSKTYEINPKRQIIQQIDYEINVKYHSHFPKIFYFVGETYSVAVCMKLRYIRMQIAIFCGIIQIEMHSRKILMNQNKKNRTEQNKLILYYSHCTICKLMRLFLGIKRKTLTHT